MASGRTDRINSPAANAWVAMALSRLSSPVGSSKYGSPNILADDDRKNQAECTYVTNTLRGE